jgi:hypothetical protein
VDVALKWAIITNPPIFPMSRLDSHSPTSHA